MAHFRGTISGQRGDASRLGSKHSGMTVEAQSWQGKVVTRLYHDEVTGLDMAEVKLEPHFGNGTSRTLYVGPVSGAPAEKKFRIRRTNFEGTVFEKIVAASDLKLSDSILGEVN